MIIIALITACLLWTAARGASCSTTRIVLARTSNRSCLVTIFLARFGRLPNRAFLLRRRRRRCCSLPITRKEPRHEKHSFLLCAGSRRRLGRRSGRAADRTCIAFRAIAGPLVAGLSNLRHRRTCGRRRHQTFPIPAVSTCEPLRSPCFLWRISMLPHDREMTSVAAAGHGGGAP